MECVGLCSFTVLPSSVTLKGERPLPGRGERAPGCAGSRHRLGARGRHTKAGPTWATFCSGPHLLRASAAPSRRAVAAGIVVGVTANTLGTERAGDSHISSPQLEAWPLSHFAVPVGHLTRGPGWGAVDTHSGADFAWGAGALAESGRGPPRRCGSCHSGPVRSPPPPRQQLATLLGAGRTVS